MTGKKAVIDGNDEVVNIIIADDEYSHPTDSIVDAADRSVGPGDRYQPETETFITPAVQIDAPSKITNDGSEIQIEIATTAATSQSVTIEIADYSTTVPLAPDGTHIETVSTTQSAGATIQITAESQSQSDIRGDSATIAVVDP
jgi:hypothetical protein